MKKLRKIDTKKDDYSVKSSKKKLRSTQMAMKAARSSSDRSYKIRTRKSRKLLAKAYKFELKSAKLQKKGHKWVSAMNREFENVKITDISADDRSLGKRYALELMERNKK